MGRLKGLLFLGFLGGGILAAAPAPILASQTTELRGQVLDQHGQPLPGVTLVLANRELAFAGAGTVTNADGTYRFVHLPPGGGYRLRATLPTFAPVEFSDIELSVDQTSTVDIVLRPAAEIQQILRVPGKAPVVDTESVTTSTTFTSGFIAGLPVLGRDYQDILSLAPGVTDVNGTGNPNVHGARDTGVVTLVDGVSTTDPFTGYFGQQLNIESIQEMEVITAGASAEFSRAQGGFANIVTKSGGNEFLGTFKLFLRSSLLDGDGAGIDPPEVRGGIGEASGYRKLEFKDLYPFLSLSGPVVRDRLWYYVTGESTLVETPQNSLTQIYVTRSHGYRAFGKATWQTAASQKLTFSALADRMIDENQGLDSLSEVASGYALKRGGPTVTVKETGTFGPRLLLDSTVSWFDNNFSLTPTTNPDTNHNGILSVDRMPWLGGNGDGIFQASEVDAGRDFDRDGKWDIYEDLNHNQSRDPGEDLDGDGRWTHACEGEEDLNCDGYISREVDKNLNGIADPGEDTGVPCENPMLCPEGFAPGTRGNGKLDTEDVNGNGVLDTVKNSGATSFPFWKDTNRNGRPDTGEFLAPEPGDAFYFRDQFNRHQGPYPRQYEDHRKRFSLKEDLSLFITDFFGTHDLKAGGVWEHEGFDRTLVQRPEASLPGFSLASPQGGGVSIPGGTLRKTIKATLGIPSQVENGAVGDNLGLFLQDTYKPIPNLTLGLGLRVDSEQIRSEGYTPFDPVAERREYNDALGLAGRDADPYDPVIPLSLAWDPIYAAAGGATNPRVAQVSTALAGFAPKYLTRHNASVDVLTPFISSFLPGSGPGSSLPGLIAAGVKVRQREAFAVTNINLSPRLSVSWDPFADGRTKAFGSWGRFYDKIFLEAVTGELGPDTQTRDYVFDEDGFNWARLGVTPDNGFGRILEESELSASQVDRGLRTPFTVEWTAGFQRELAPEISFSLTYIHRDYKDQLQDVDINHFTRVDPATGRFADLLGQEYPIERPALDPDPQHDSPAERVPDGLPDLYIQNFLFNRIMRLGNTNAQTYRGLELEVVRRLRRKWQMEGSYTYSRAWGDAESYRSSAGDDPTVTEFEPGYLDYDQRHVVKLNTVAFLPGDWTLGWRAEWASGLPYSVLEVATAADDVGYVQDRRRFGIIDPRLGFFPEHRNIHRNHATYDFNVRTQKNFVLGKASASAFLEVFNLLNSDDLRIHTVYPQFANSLDGERRFGRRYQIGFQVDF